MNSAGKICSRVSIMGHAGPRDARAPRAVLPHGRGSGTVLRLTSISRFGVCIGWREFLGWSINFEFIFIARKACLFLIRYC